MIDRRLVRIHLSSGSILTAVYGVKTDMDDEDIEAEILAELQANPREFLNLGGVIVHTGAISAVELT